VHDQAGCPLTEHGVLVGEEGAWIFSCWAWGWREVGGLGKGSAASTQQLKARLSPTGYQNGTQGMLIQAVPCCTVLCQVALHRRWRLLSLLQPPFDLQHLPAVAEAASTAAAAYSIPPAGDGALPDTMSVWLAEVEAAELASGGHPPLFQPYSKPAQQSAADIGAAGSSGGADQSGSRFVATSTRGDAAELHRMLRSMGCTDVVQGGSLTAAWPKRSLSDDK